MNSSPRYSRQAEKELSNKIKKEIDKQQTCISTEKEIGVGNQ